MKKLLAVTAAFIMALSMAACGETSDDDDNESKAPKKSLSVESEDAKEGDVTKEAETPSAEEQTPADTEATTTTTQAETEPAVTQPLGENDYAGSSYRMTVDPANWTTGTSTAQVDVIYQSTKEATTNFNVVTSPSNGAKVTDLATYGDQLKKMYEEYGYTVNEIMPKQYNGKDYLYTEIQVDVQGITMKQSQYYFVNDTEFVIFTYTSSNTTYDTYLGDFTAVLDTLILT